MPIWFGLPFDRARPDEETALAHALAVVAGDPNPHFFHWPSFIFYLFAGALAVAPHASVNTQYLIARGVVAAAGTATIAALYVLVRDAADETTALVAAGLLAVAPLHVRESHFAMTDVVMTLLVTVALAIDLRAHARPRWWAAAGALAGLAASTKYTGAATLALLVLPPYRPAAMMAFAGAFLLGFVAGTPYAVLDAHSFLGGFGFDVTHLSAGQAFVDVGRGWSYHAVRSLPFGVGVITFAAAMAGIALMAQRRCRAAAAPATVALALYAGLAPGRTVFFRYVLPIVPLLCAAAAVAVCDVAKWWSTRFRTRALVWPAAALVALPAAVNSVRLDALLAKTDTRVIAGRWLAARARPEQSVYDAGGDYAGSDLRDVVAHRWAVATFDPVANVFRDSGGQLPDWLVLPESPLVYGTVPAALRQLAASHYTLVQTVAATDGPTDRSVYDVQDAFFLPVAGFGAIVRPGPTVRIYRLAP